MTSDTVAIVGPGSVGTSLGILLAAAGCRITLVVGRRLESARSAVSRIGAGTPVATPHLASAPRWLFVTTQDDALAATAASIAECGPSLAGTIAVHASGFLPGDVLRPLRERGARLGSMHPLKSFGDPREAARTFPGTACFLEGDEDAVEALAQLVTTLRGVPLRIRTRDKALYHAAASLASNALVAVLWSAGRLLLASGVDAERGRSALLELARGTLANVASARAIEQALTGPIERGDLQVLEGHLRSIADRCPQEIDVYRSLARAILRVAQAKGSLDDEARSALLAALEEPRR